MAASNQYDRLNDQELGSGIFSDVKQELGAAMEELKKEPNWEEWYDKAVPENADFQAILEIVNDHLENPFAPENCDWAADPEGVQ